MIYGKINTISQHVGGEHPGDGWVEMDRQRQDNTSIARADGTWGDPAPTASQRRAERDTLIEAVNWRVERYASEIRQGLSPTEDIAGLDAYIQALRDIPQQAGFPESVEWPTPPGAE